MILTILLVYSIVVTAILAQVFAAPLIAYACFVLGCVKSIVCAPFRRDDDRTMQLVPS